MVSLCILFKRIWVNAARYCENYTKCTYAVWGEM